MNDLSLSALESLVRAHVTSKLGVRAPFHLRPADLSIIISKYIDGSGESSHESPALVLFMFSSHYAASGSWVSIGLVLGRHSCMS